MYTKIIGTGGYLPKKIRTNYDLENIINTSNDWIISRTGIKERRIAEFNENVVTMGYYASIEAINMAKINKSNIGLLIVATTSSSHAFPSSACQIQKLLKINDTIAFDLAAACAGFAYALSVADQYIKNRLVNYALIIGSDVLSTALSENDRNTFILFGDGAGAVILTSTKKPGILSTNLHANGKYGDLLTLANYDRKNFKKPQYITMIGKEVFKIAVIELTKIIYETLKLSKFNFQELDWLIPHQANLRIIRAVAKKIGIKMEKIIIILDKYGNTSSASIPLALNESIRDGRIKTGNLILIEAFGSGFVWGSALIKM